MTQKAEAKLAGLERTLAAVRREYSTARAATDLRYSTLGIGDGESQSAGATRRLMRRFIVVGGLRIVCAGRIRQPAFVFHIGNQKTTESCAFPKLTPERVQEHAGNPTCFPQNQCYSRHSILKARYAFQARKGSAIATTNEARRHISARVTPAVIESFEAVRKERKQSRSAAIEEAMREFALGRAETMGIRAAGVAERVESLADTVSEEAEAGRDLAKAHRKSLGGLLIDNRYTLEAIYALLEQVFPRAGEVRREDMREVAHRRIQAERRQIREEAEGRNGDGS